MSHIVHKLKGIYWKRTFKNELRKLERRNYMLEAKRRAAIFFILAFILATVSGYLILQKVKDLNSELGGMTEVYVAKGDIPSRTVIQENQLTVMDLPNKFVTDSHVTDRKDLQHQVSVVPLSAGDIITRNMIKPVANLQDENNRLVTLHRTETVQFDQVVEALDRVDIIVSTNDDNKKETKLFMKDVLVAFSQGTGENFSGIAVEVSSEEAPKLIHMQNFAEHIRILKANVGKDEQLPEPTEEETPVDEEDPEDVEKTEEKKEEKKEEKPEDDEKEKKDSKK